MISKHLLMRPNIRTTAFDWMGEDVPPYLGGDHFLGRSPFDIAYRNTPPVNARRDKSLMVLEVAVPGFEKNELRVTVMDDVLIVRGVREKSRAKDSEYILEEFDYDSFERRFKLKHGIGHEKINATYSRGILRITFVDVPVEEEREMQSIEVS